MFFRTSEAMAGAAVERVAAVEAAVETARVAAMVGAAVVRAGAAVAGGEGALAAVAGGVWEKVGVGEEGEVLVLVFMDEEIK